MDQKPSAGWYDDGHGATRWWDGTAWTAHTAPVVRQDGPSPSSATPTSPSSGRAPSGAGPAVRHAAVLDRPATGAYAARPTAPRGSAAAGIALVLAGLTLGGLVLASMAWASEHGGLLWIGGLFVSASLVLRGIAAFSPGSSTARAAVGTHNWINAPRAQSSGSSVLKVLAVAVVGFVGLLGAAAVVGGASHAASPMPITPHVPAAGSGQTSVPAVDAAPWYPFDYTPVGRNGAFAYFGYSPAECRPGTSCGHASVVYRTSCRTLYVRVAFYDDPSRVKDRATYRLTRTKAAKPRHFRVSTTANVSEYRVTSFRCVR